MIPSEPRLPQLGGEWPKNLTVRIAEIYRAIVNVVNAAIGGKISAFPAMTAAPTTGTWAQGDFVLNSTPSEAGAGGSKYIIHGWRCTVGGTPGTWLEIRALTGN